MDKGRMIYVDESGKKLVTRKFICDMRPVRSGCGMHIVNTFRYGGLRSAEEFLCFAGRFARLYEERKVEIEEELVREVLLGAATFWLEPESYCYVMRGYHDHLLRPRTGGDGLPPGGCL